MVMRCLKRTMRMNIVNTLCLIHCVGHGYAEDVAGPNMGAGEEYLELTETKWDGKTPWFTGSSMSGFNLLIMIELSLQLVSVMVGPQDVSLVRSCSGRLDGEEDVSSARETGDRGGRLQA